MQACLLIDWMRAFYERRPGLGAGRRETLKIALSASTR